MTEERIELASLRDIGRERVRQIQEENWTAEHDDQHEHGELALAAALFATPVTLYERNEDFIGYHFVDPWPWADEWDKRPTLKNYEPMPGKAMPYKTRRDLLVKAGALIAAEIDRLDRAHHVPYPEDMEQSPSGGVDKDSASRLRMDHAGEGPSE